MTDHRRDNREDRAQSTEKRQKNRPGSGFLVPGAVLLCALTLSGCVTGSDMETLRGNVSSLQVESISQKRDISQLKSDMAALSGDVASLKDYSLSAMRESQSSLLSQTSDLSRELQALKGRFDEYKYFMDKTTSEITAEREVLQARVSNLEKELDELRGGAPASGTKQPPVTAGPEAAMPAEADQDTQRFYDDAQVALREGHYDEARKQFEEFVEKHPRHRLVPNARFWIGETYYGEKRYEDAILAYEALLKKYPDHDKARAAMLKQAYSFIELGDKKTGRVILERIREKYPETREADMAKEKLSALSPKKKP